MAEIKLKEASTGDNYGSCGVKESINQRENFGFFHRFNLMTGYMKLSNEEKPVKNRISVFFMVSMNIVQICLADCSELFKIREALELLNMFDF